MANDDHTKEYFEKWKSMKLSSDARDRMERELLSYARFHTAREGVRVGEDSRSIGQEVPQRTSLMGLLMLTRKHMTALGIALVLMVSGGTSYAAQAAVPGDFLYPVKTEINENVRAALAVSANAEARLQAQLLEERVEEAAELRAEGRLEGKTATAVSHEVEMQAKKARDAATESDQGVALAAQNQITLALGNYNTLMSANTDLQINTDTLFATEGDADANLGTSLSLEPIAIEVLIANTEARIEGLRETIVRHEAEFEASARARMSAKLDASAKLILEAKATVGDEARERAYDAADLAGEVEAELSTLGTVEIDSDTGAIIDIDTSVVPPKEYEGERVIELDLEGDATVGGDASTGSGSIELDTQTDVDVDTDIIDVKSDASVDVESGLSL